MPDVLGLDLGISTAGVAILPNDGPLQSWTYTAQTPADGTLDDTLTRIDNAVHWALRWADARPTRPVLAVVENLPFNSKHGQHHERTVVHYRVLAGLRRRRIPVALVQSSTGKRWATGKGNASKAAMKRAVSALWPGHGLARASEHEIDALTMAGIGAHWSGWDGPWFWISDNILNAVTWPHQHT